MAKPMLFQSIVEAAIAGSLDQASPIVPGEIAERARVVVDYFESIARQQDHLQSEHEGLHTKPAPWEATPKVCQNITSAVVNTLCSLYGDIVQYKFDDATPDGKRAAELFARIPGWASIMRDVDIYTFLAGLLAVRPIWRERAVVAERIKFAMYQPDQITYVQDPEDMSEAQELAFTFTTGQGDSETTVGHYWSAEKFVETVDDIVIPDKKRPGNVNPYQTMPITLFRNRANRWGFYGEPAWDLVVANLAINGQTTMLNRLAIQQAFSTLMTIGAPEGFVPSVGLDTYINVTNPPGGSGAGAQFLQPNANIQGVIDTINTCLSLFFGARRIPESAILAKQVGDSGISLVAQSSSLAAYRKDRIATMRPQEEDLIRKTLKVMHFHETGELRDFPAPQITYTELKVAMAVDDRDEWDWKISHGVATELDLFKSLRPGMDDKKAEELFAANKAERRERMLAAMPARRVLGDDEEDVGDAEELEADDITATAGKADAPAEDVAKTALNGAQVTALQGIIASVSDSTLSRGTAEIMIGLAFPMFTPEDIARMVGAVVVKPAAPTGTE